MKVKGKKTAKMLLGLMCIMDEQTRFPCLKNLSGGKKMKRYLSSMMVVMMFLMCFTGVTGGMVKADEVNPEFIYDFEDVTITDGTGEIDTSKFVGVGSPPADKQAIIDSSDVVYENGTEGNKVLEIPTTSSPFYIYNKALHTTLGTNKYQVYEIAVKLPEGIPSSSEQYHQFQVGLFGSDWAANTGGTYALIQDYKLKEGGRLQKYSVAVRILNFYRIHGMLCAAWLDLTLILIRRPHMFMIRRETD